jgi:hypothetical protein
MEGVVQENPATAKIEAETAQIKNDLEEVTNEHLEQQLFHETYKHMLNRMKKDLIALQLVSNDLTESLKSKQQI